MNLSELFGKTAEKKCPCCGGIGEHDTGFECFLCDAGRTVPESTPDDARCDGRLPDGGHGETASGAAGMLCVYPHDTTRRTAGEYGPEPSMHFDENLSWTQARQYGAEDDMRKDLPHYPIGSVDEAQQLANKVTDKARASRVVVQHRPGQDYSFAQAHPDGGRTRIVLGDGGMNHHTLLHELAHHLDEESRDHDEDHGDSFRDHFEKLLVDHHPNSYVARDAFRHRFHWADQKMRDGVEARRGQPNPEMNEREKAAPPVEKPTPLWQSDPDHVSKANNALRYRSEPHSYLKYMPHYPETDFASDEDYEREDAHMADEDLSKGLSPHLVPPHMLAAWVKHHPNPKALEEPEWDEEGNDKPLHHTGARKPYTEDVNDDRSVTMQYHRNTTPAPRQVNHYHGQDIEPHGQYFTQGPLHGDIPGYETGEKSFQRPLRLFSPTDDPSQPHHWKQQLQRRYNATGKALSQAIRDDGYDAILTHDEYGPSESVDLSSFQPRQAAEDAGVYRGLSIVLPPEIHKMVHDPAQPHAARAHMLLSEIRKQKESHAGEDDASGPAGGIGSFWTPHRSKAEEYATQNGYTAYREHELEHNCGDPDYGEGGCPTTRVIVHAKTPHEKHQWKEIFRPGEQYHPEISWRLPIRPGAPMRVRGISWKEGKDNLPMRQRYSEEGMAEERKPYDGNYDFMSEVRKKAGANGDLPEGLTFEHKMDKGLHTLLARHPEMPGDNHFAGVLGWWDKDGEIGGIEVHPQMQRRGLATELYRRAKEITPHLHHSEYLTPEAKQWISGMGQHTAATTFEPSFVCGEGEVHANPHLATLGGHPPWASSVYVAQHAMTSNGHDLVPYGSLDEAGQAAQAVLKAHGHPRADELTTLPTLGGKSWVVKEDELGEPDEQFRLHLSRNHLHNHAVLHEMAHMLHLPDRNSRTDEESHGPEFVRTFRSLLQHYGHHDALAAFDQHYQPPQEPEVSQATKTASVSPEEYARRDDLILDYGHTGSPGE